MRYLFAPKPHELPFELKCPTCEEWQPANEIFRLDTYHTRILICSVCGTEVEDGEIQCIDVNEVLGYKALYDAQKENDKFYRSEESNGII